MMKIIKVAFVAAIVVGSGINVFNARKDVELSDIGKENVEALANDETSGEGSCSKAIAWANCYNYSNGLWNCLIIKAVRKYDVEEGSINVCHHDKVTECPDGTYER